MPPTTITEAQRGAGGVRIVITGIGAFTPHGAGWDRLRTAIARGESALGRAGADLPGAEDLTVGLVRDLSPFRTAFPKVRPPLPVRHTQFALVAAADALHDAGLVAGDRQPELGVALDRTWDSDAIAAQLVQPSLAGGPHLMSPLLFSQSVANAPAGAIARFLGAQGPNLVTLGGGAVSLAFLALGAGDALGMLCGGLEELEPLRILAHQRAGYIDCRWPPEAYRPSAQGPDRSPVPTVGEGSIMLVLEEEAAALGRGARPHAEVLAVADRLDCAGGEPGWGEPRAADIEALVDGLLRRGARMASEIDLIISGSNGVAGNEAAERECLERMGLSERPCHGLKGLLGETGGMAAPASLALAADALARGEIAGATGRWSAVSRPSKPTLALVLNVGPEGHLFGALLAPVPS